ncbi:MAG: holo-ACP synthase [Bacilli bacterium]|nr:holo-ACP synthase [Bacilli bacterium]
MKLDLPLINNKINNIGIDLVYLPRMENKIDNKSFINRILSENEQLLYYKLTNKRRKIEFLGGRYACKEAYAKALGLGIGKVDFHDLEVLYDSNNALITNKEVNISLSHDQDYAIAIVLIGDNK